MLRPEDVYREILDQIEFWSDVVADELTDPESRFGEDSTDTVERVRHALVNSGIEPAEISKMVEDYAVMGLGSVLKMFDGATVLAEKGVVDMVDGNGNVISNALSDEFGLYYLENKRWD